MQPFHRRLAAVLALDVAGYSRLIAADEDGTYVRLRALFGEAVEPRIQAAGGAVFKRAGDGLLAEFPSVVEAVRCALAAQAEAEARAALVPLEGRLRLRMGVSLGDVIEDGDDRYGDGVNLAARLESVAGVGEVVVSEAAVRVTEGTGLRFQDLGLKQLKNFVRPVRAYRALPDGAGIVEHAPTGPVPGFGGRPAIAVLPFRASGADKVFADGLTEDLITAVAHWRSFPVISRASSFAWYGRDADVREVAAALGARYVHEGTVRRVGRHVRVAIGLVDADTGETLLAETFDGNADDLFTLQDGIAREIMGRLQPELLRREGERARLVPAPRASTYELYQRGLWHHYRYTCEDNETARGLFVAALEAEPDYPQAEAALSIALCHAVRCNWLPREPTYTMALSHAQRAVHFDPRDPGTQYALGMALSHINCLPESLERLRETVRLHPSHAGAHAMLAFSYNYMNCPERAWTHVQIAMRLSPQDPRRYLWLPAVAGSRYLAREYKAALSAGQEALAASTNPGLLPIVRYVVASMGQLERRAEATTVLPLLRRVDPDLAASERILRQHFVAPAAEHILCGLRRAGFT